MKQVSAFQRTFGAFFFFFNFKILNLKQTIKMMRSPLILRNTEKLQVFSTAFRSLSTHLASFCIWPCFLQMALLSANKWL